MHREESQSWTDWNGVDVCDIYLLGVEIHDDNDKKDGGGGTCDSHLLFGIVKTLLQFLNPSQQADILLSIIIIS